MVTFAEISTKMVNLRNRAGNEEEEEELQRFSKNVDCDSVDTDLTIPRVSHHPLPSHYPFLSSSPYLSLPYLPRPFPSPYPFPRSLASTYPVPPRSLTFSCRPSSIPSHRPFPCPSSVPFLHTDAFLLVPISFLSLLPLPPPIPRPRILPTPPPPFPVPFPPPSTSLRLPFSPLFSHSNSLPSSLSPSLCLFSSSGHRPPPPPPFNPFPFPCPFCSLSPVSLSSPFLSLFSSHSLPLLPFFVFFRTALTLHFTQ